MPKLSTEATIGLLFEVVLGILDHLHVREPILIWGLFTAGLVLIGDSVLRGEWSTKITDPRKRERTKAFWAALTVLAFSLFGWWVYARLHQSESGEQTAINPSSGTQRQTAVPPAPFPDPAGFVDFLGVVQDGHAFVVQENGTDTPLDDVKLSVTKIIPKDVSNFGNGIVAWQKDINVGTCRARLSTSIPGLPAFPIYGESLIRFSILMPTRLQTYREDMDLRKDKDGRHYSADLKFYGATLEPLYVKHTTLMVAHTDRGTTKPADLVQPETTIAAPTLRSLMEGFMPNVGRVAQNKTLTFPDGLTARFEDALLLDFAGGSRYMTIYIPSSSRTYEAAMYTGEHASDLRRDLTSLTVTAKSPGESPQSVDSLVDTGRVYLYHDDFLNHRQMADIEAAYTAQHLHVELRGPDYLANALGEWGSKKYGIQTGPCSNVQLGGSNNKATANCSQPPLELAASLRVIMPAEKALFFDSISCPVHTQIRLVPNQKISPPLTISLEFDNPVTNMAAKVEGANAGMLGGPFRNGVHAMTTVVSPGTGPNNPLVVEVCSALPVRLVEPPRVD